MPTISFSKKDLLRDKIVAPAWYRMQIDTVGEWSDSKNKQSKNLVLEGTILFNADNGSEEFAGVPVGGMGTWNFNTKVSGFALGLAKALASQCGYHPDEITTETKLEMKVFEGKFCDVFVDNNTFEGRIKNKVTHKYREPKL